MHGAQPDHPVAPMRISLIRAGLALAVIVCGLFARLKVSARLGLREEFSERSGYSADEVLDRYAHVVSGASAELEDRP